MISNLCEFCKKNTANFIVKITINGKQKTFHICTEDYNILKNQIHTSLPVTSQITNENLLDNSINDFDEINKTSHHHHNLIDINNYCSKETKEIIQKAGFIAVEFDRDQIDTEHLLYALSENNLIQKVLKESNIDTFELKEYIKTFTKKGAKHLEHFEEIELSTTQEFENVIKFGFNISKEIGSSYIEPIHILIGLGQEKGLAKDILNNLNKNFISKIYEIVSYNFRDKDLVEKIVTTQLEKLSQAGKKNRIELCFDESLIKYLCDSKYSLFYINKEITNKINNEVITNLEEKILNGDISNGDKLNIFYNFEKMEISFKKTNQIAS